MATRKGGMSAFEKSRFDVEKPGEKEGSKADMARDKKQAKAAGFAKGGIIVKGTPQPSTYRRKADGIAQRGKTEARKVAMK